MFRRLFLLLLCLACLAGASPNWAQSRRERTKTKTSRKKTSERSRTRKNNNDDTPKRKRTSRRDDDKPTAKRTSRKDEPKKSTTRSKDEPAAKPKSAAKPPASPGDKKPAASGKPVDPKAKPLTGKTPEKMPASPAAAKPVTEKPAPVAAKPTASIKPAVAPIKVSPATGDPMIDGDRWYTEKSYAAALKAYRQAIALKKVPQGRRPQVDYRIARCYALTKQWTQALSEPLAVAARYPGSVWDARMRAWLMRVYLIVPHYAWKVGDQLVRSQEMPEVTGSQVPERVSVFRDDHRKAIQYGEQAKALYEKVRASQPDTSEEADHSADLARSIATLQVRPWAQAHQWKAPKDEVWMLDPDARFNSAWAPPQKVLQLFLAAERLGNDAQKPVARLAQATWLRGYHSLMRWAAVKPSPTGPPESIPYPYQDRDEVAALRSMVQDYPAHPEAEHARIMVADWLNRDRKFAAALAVYRGFLIDKPESPWAAHAKTAADEITRKALAIEEPTPQAPGARAKLEIAARNVPVLKFTARRLKLEEAARDARVLGTGSPLTGFTNILDRLGKGGAIRKFLHDEDPVIWETPLTTAEPGKPEPAEFTPVHRFVETPLTKNGAYLIEADGGPVRETVLLIISDLAVLSMVDNRRTHAMVVNAATGAPVFEASTLIREVYDDAKKKRSVSAATVLTDTDGIAEKPVAPARLLSQQVEVLAWKGDRYALVNFVGGWYTQPGSGNEFTARVYTDRSLYRPGQRLYYRALLASRAADEAWKPLPGVNALVRVYNPEGNVVTEQRVTAGRFGSVSGKLDLSPGSPLGAYRIAVAWAEDEESEKPELRQAVEHNSAFFRIEEYKRPEFKVEVARPRDARSLPKPGETVEAVVSARYYFGAPVANAAVKYRVTVDRSYPSSPFPRGLDDPESIDTAAAASQPRTAPYDDSFWQEPVATGTAVTDAAGQAVVRFKRPAPRPGSDPVHLVFDVYAEVTDAGRRTIGGTGSVLAPDAAFDAFLRPRKGFFPAGASLEAEIVTQDATGSPVAARGTVVIFRRTYRGSKPEFQEVHRAPAVTAATGRGTVSWSGATGGFYVVRFEAADDADRRITGQTGVWVDGASAGESVDPEHQVALVAEAPSYSTGDSARVLFVSRTSDQPAYLTREAGGRLLEKRLERTNGSSRIFELPLEVRDAPDFLLAVTGIHDRRMFRRYVNLAVRPADHLLQLRVTADKARYEPGEKATLRVQARDVNGRPVQVECSVGVVDDSLRYIHSGDNDVFADGLYVAGRGSDLDALAGLELTFGSLAENDQPDLKWPEIKWLFPTGLGSISRDAANSVDAESFAQVGQSTEPPVPADPRGRITTGPPGVGRPPEFTEGRPPLVASPEPEFAASRVGMGGPRLEKTLARSIRTADAAGAAQAGSPPAVRRNFNETAFWNPEVITDANGEATVTFTWPDSLTRWHTTVRGWTEAAQLGETTAVTETSKDLLVRLQSPRFFIERDEIVLSANVHNYTSVDRRIRVGLQLEGDTLYPAGSSPFGPPQPREFEVPRADRPRPVSLKEGSPTAPTAGSDLVRWVEVPAQGEARVDWTVRAERPGEARVRVLAESDTLADAVELKFPTYVHGAAKTVVKNGALMMAAGEKSGKRELKIGFQVPVERVPDAGQLVVHVTPSLAATVLDSLPYLVDYPYGCVEQTLSRFLPAVVSARSLLDLGLEFEDLQKRAEAEYERRKSAAATHVVANSPYSSPEALAAELGDLERMRWHAQRNPVFQPAVLESMIQDGLNRLRQAQNADGSWGWWKGDTGDERMTAYVVHGLLVGRSAEMCKPESLNPMIDRGLAFLAKKFPTEVNRHDQVLLGWVLSMDRKRAPAVGATLMEKVYPQREALTAYSLALLAMTLKQCGLKAEALTCLANLENTAKIDRGAGTCYWNNDRGTSWGWWNHDVETAAACLRAYNAVDPGHRLAPLVVRWLTNNRRGSSWDTTRGTAMAVEALVEYAKLHKELAPDCRVTVAVSGGPSRTFTLDADSALLADGRLVVPATVLGPGARTVTITRDGRGSLYYTATLQYFTLEEGIRGTTGEVRVARRYFRLTRPVEKDEKKDEKKDSKPALTSDGYVRTEVRSGEKLTSGDLLEVDLLLESKNGYEHLVLEDMKPAGCEPVDLKSGTRYAGGLCSNMELRDEKIAFFLTRLPQGRHRLSYRLRAEVPGQFHALPVGGYAMYAPEIRFLSDETILGIADPAGGKTVSHK